MRCDSPFGYFHREVQRSFSDLSEPAALLSHHRRAVDVGVGVGFGVGRATSVGNLLLARAPIFGVVGLFSVSVSRYLAISHKNENDRLKLILIVFEKKTVLVRKLKKVIVQQLKKCLQNKIKFVELICNLLKSNISHHPLSSHFIKHILKVKVY